MNKKHKVHGAGHKGRIVQAFTLRHALIWFLNVKCQSFRLRLPSHNGPAMAGQANVK